MQGVRVIVTHKVAILYITTTFDKIRSHHHTHLPIELRMYTCTHAHVYMYTRAYMHVQQLVLW